MEADRSIQTLARWLDDARRVVALTGAGISTESGIPDFRSPGGVWSRHQPVYIQDFLRSHDARRRYWAIRKESYPDFIKARPNAGHVALAQLESVGKLTGVITQNIDELHQRAGSRRVLELHGTARRINCLNCHRAYTDADVQHRLMDGVEVPTCDACGGWLKSATVSFGQVLPAEVLSEATMLARGCDLFIAIGTSLVVQPAGMLPLYAKQAGARFVLINLSETPLDDLADLIIRRPISEAFSGVMHQLDAWTNVPVRRTGS